MAYLIQVEFTALTGERVVIEAQTCKLAVHNGRCWVSRSTIDGESEAVEIRESFLEAQSALMTAIGGNTPEGSLTFTTKPTTA